MLNLNLKKNNYADAAKFYEISISLDDKQYVFFENAAITYDNLENYSKAEEYFNKVIYDFSTEDGRAEFFKGLMLIKYEDNLNGCRYLKSSSEKNYI